MKSQVKLIASDYDGTVRRNGEISRDDVEAIAEWRRAGRYFGIVTGRGTDFLKTVREREIREAGLGVDYVVMYNGALVTDVEGNEWFSGGMEKEDFQALETFFRDLPNVVSYSKTEGDGPFLQFFAQCDSPERALELAGVINEKMGERVEAFVNYWHINVVRRGVSKATGVSVVMEHYGLSEEESVVVGDDWNDLSMLAAHNGYVMENGVPQVQKQIGRTTPSVGALARMCLKR